MFAEIKAKKEFGGYIIIHKLCLYFVTCPGVYRSIGHADMNN